MEHNNIILKRLILYAHYAFTKFVSLKHFVIWCNLFCVLCMYPCHRPINTQKAIAYRECYEQAAGTRRTTCLHAAPVHGSHRHNEQRTGPIRIPEIRRQVRGQHIAQPATEQLVSTYDIMRFTFLLFLGGIIKYMLRVLLHKVH